MKQTFQKLASFTVAFAMVFGLSFMTAEAAPMTDLSDNMSRQKVDETAQHVITVTLPTALAGGEDLDITFPAGFDVSSATLAASTPAATLNIASQVLEFDFAGGVSAGGTVTLTVDGIINPSSSGNQVITLASDGGDTGEITVPILNDDQIVVTAKVDQTLTFDVRDTTGGSTDDNAVQFGSLSSSASRYATDDGTGSASPVDSSEFEAGTNASGGYTVAVSGSTLTSGANTIDALSTAATPSPGTEQFGIAVSNGAGSGHGAIDSSYTGGTYYLDTTSEDEIVSTSGPSADATYDVSYLANITSATEAGDYSTALTYTMTANY